MKLRVKEVGLSTGGPLIVVLNVRDALDLDLKPGDRVLFTKYAPSEIKINNKEYLIAKQEDILAIIQ